MFNTIAKTAAALMLPAVLSFAAPTTAHAQNQVCAEDSTGTSDGFFYSMYRRKGTGCLTMYNRYGGGNFAVNWDLLATGPVGDRGDLVAGKGWSTGNDSRRIGYNIGQWPNNNTNGWVGLYGWTVNPVVEYYVVETWGEWRPAQGQRMGSVTSDGATYDIYYVRRYGDNITGQTQSFDQFWSVRTSRKSNGQNGTITFRNHANAWRNVGMRLGYDWRYQIFAVEGYGSSGSANATVWQQ